MGGAKASGAADITVASVSSIISKDRMSKFDPKRFKLILVDEAHHIVASSFMRTLQHFGLLKKSVDTGTSTESSDSTSTSPSITNYSPALVGLSATFSRFDGVRLSDAIDDIVYHKDYVDMIKDNWLSDLIFTTIQSKADISRVKSSGQDFQIGQLSKAVNNPISNDIIVQTWLSKAVERQSTLVFCVDLAHVSDLTARFRSRGIDARFVTSNTQREVRGERLEGFKKKDYPVLLNCGVFTEGTDIPNIDCILLARPTKSQNLLVQMIGRGMRLHPGKRNCHVIDMVTTLEGGVITSPTLFGLDPASLVDQASVEDLSARSEQIETEKKHHEQPTRNLHDSLIGSQFPRTVTFTDYDSIQDLIGDTSGERHIRTMSRLAWVRVRQARYILSVQGGDYLSIDVPEGGASYSVTHVRRILDSDQSDGKKAKSPYMRPQRIAQADSISSAVHAADTYALKQFPHRSVDHRLSWRKGPATEGQLAVINKMRSMRDQLTADTISKGTATDMITKIKFGAKGWFGKVEAEKKRKLRREMNLSQQEQMKVGPLKASL